MSVATLEIETARGADGLDGRRAVGSPVTVVFTVGSPVFPRYAISMSNISSRRRGDATRYDARVKITRRPRDSLGRYAGGPARKLCKSSGDAFATARRR